MKLLVEIQDNVYKSLKNNRGTAIENVMAIAAVIGGQPLPDDCEILTKEAYSDLCIRASKGNCSEIPTGSTAKIDVPDNNVGNIDCISRADAIHAVSEALKHTFVEYEDIANKVIGKLPSVTPQEPKCKDCKWWKDSDGAYRRGCGAESKCPINTHAVYCGEGYCYLFEPQESEDKE